MDEDEYISSVKEQLRAYDFNERSIGHSYGDSKSCFYHKSEGILKTIEEVVVINRIEESSVESVKNAINESVGGFDWEEDGNILKYKKWMYILLVSSDVTKAMRVAAKREAGMRGREFVLPVIADTDSMQLIYNRPSTAQKVMGAVDLHVYSTISENAKKYFKS